MIGQLIDLPKIIDTRGNLTVVEQMRQIPFDIARVYWTIGLTTFQAEAVVAGMLIALARKWWLPSAARSTCNYTTGVSGKPIISTILTKGCISVLAFGAHWKISPVVPSASYWLPNFSTKMSIFTTWMSLKSYMPHV